MPTNNSPSEYGIHRTLSDEPLFFKELGETEILHLRKNEISQHELGQTLQAIDPNQVIGVYQAYAMGFLYDIYEVLKESNLTKFHGLTVDELFLSVTEPEILKEIKEVYSNLYLPPDAWSGALYDETFKQANRISSLIQSKIFVERFFYTILEQKINWIYYQYQYQSLNDTHFNEKSQDFAPFKEQMARQMIKPIPNEMTPWIGLGGSVSEVRTINKKQEMISLLSFLFDGTALGLDDYEQLGSNLKQSALVFANQTVKNFDIKTMEVL